MECFNLSTSEPEFSQKLGDKVCRAEPRSLLVCHCRERDLRCIHSGRINRDKVPRGECELARRYVIFR